MKYICIILIGLVSSNISFSQNQEWVWGRNIGGSSGDEGQDIVADAVGNVYVTGFYYDTLIAGPDTFVTSGDAAFVCKYDSSGNLLWARNIEGGGLNDYSSLVIDSENNLYFTGFLNISAQFDTILLDSYGQYLLKIDPNGNLLWSNRIVTTQGGFIDIDQNDNIYCVGSSKNISYNGDTLLSNNLSYEVFVLKFDKSGNLLWSDYSANISGTSGAANVISIAVGGNGNLHIFGDVLDIHLINADTVGDAGGFYKRMLIRYSPSGTVLSAATMNQLTGAIGPMVVDILGNSYLTGRYNGSNPNWGPLILRKFDPQGNVIFNKYLGGGTLPSMDGRGADITFDNENNLLICGYWEGQGTLDTVPIDASGNFKDLFVAKFDTAGNALWAMTNGNVNEYEEFQAISIDQFGNCYMTGYMNTQLMLGNLVPEIGGKDILIARIKYDVAPPALSVNVSSGDASVGNCDGTATASVNGGSIPYSYSWNSNPVQTTATANGLCPGIYQVTIVDNVSDTVYASVTIIEVATSAPVADFGADVVSIGLGDTVNFTDLSTNIPNAWLWGFDSANPVSSTDQNPANIIYGVTGCHEVTLTAMNSIGSDSIAKSCYIEVTTVGIKNDDIELGMPITIHPNPTEGAIFLTGVSKTIGGILSVFNSLGELVHSERLTNHVNIGHLSKGIYLLQFQTGDNTVRQKVILY